MGLFGYKTFGQLREGSKFYILNKDGSIGYYKVDYVDKDYGRQTVEIKYREDDESWFCHSFTTTMSCNVYELSNGTTFYSDIAIPKKELRDKFKTEMKEEYNRIKSEEIAKYEAKQKEKQAKKDAQLAKDKQIQDLQNQLNQIQAQMSNAAQPAAPKQSKKVFRTT